jgi:hypothetical protein
MKTVIQGEEYEVSRSRVIEAMSGKEPETVQTHSVLVDGTAYPPKQVLEEAIGVERSRFGTQRAVNVLRKLGFTLSNSRGSVPPNAPTAFALADRDHREARSTLSITERLDIVRVSIDYVGRPPHSTIDDLIKTARRIEEWVQRSNSPVAA